VAGYGDGGVLMAVLHRAFTFSPEPFHRRMAEAIAAGQELDLRALHQMAQAALHRATSETWQALEAMRFEQRWLDVSEPDLPHSTEWYALLLAQELTSAPGLSRDGVAAFAILRQALPALEWEQGDIDALIFGDPLQTLLASAGDARFTSEFAGIDQYGGWLSQTRLRHMSSKLQSAQSSAAATAPQITNLLEEIGVFSPAESLRVSLTMAQVMVQTAMDREQALFLVLD
jgi:hypothetical protein